jgi:ubiquinone/menaquinone biosynthesis C-methylase UbiE
LIATLKHIVHRARRRILNESSADFWTRYNVTLHRRFSSAPESLAYFHWRNHQYIDYERLMPVGGQDGRVVLDYGCGPGNDLVGFGTYSAPSRLIGVDVSRTSLEQASVRLSLHNIKAELIPISESDKQLPFADASIDYIHSSGVVHHTPDPLATLREFRRIIRSDGAGRVMVYNYNSLWLHLHVAYVQRVLKGRYRNLPIREAYSRFTDGEECPIAFVYKPSEFIALSNQAGFDCVHTGSALAAQEMADFPMRWSAIMSEQLEHEHRQFLSELRLDDRGLPMYEDALAGQDGCFLLRPRS